MKINKIDNYTDFEKYFKELDYYLNECNKIRDQFYIENPNYLGTNLLNDKIHLFNLDFQKITKFNLNNDYDLFYYLNNILVELEYNLNFYYDLDNIYIFNNDLSYFKDFEFNIDNLYYIIIDNENKKIFNLNENNIKSILIKLFEDYNKKFNTNLNIKDIDALIENDFNTIEKIEKQLEIYNIIYDLY